MINQEAHEQSGLSLLMRSLRRGARLTQEKFADELNQHLADRTRRVSRWDINRIENGHKEISRELAEGLDALAKSLRDSRPFMADVPNVSFGSLTAEREADTVERQSYVDVTRLIGAPGLERLYIVLCDLTDVASSVAQGIRAGGTAPCPVTVVVPPPERQKQLFQVPQNSYARGRPDAGQGDDGLYDDYRGRLEGHLAVQITHLQRLADHSRIDLRIYESYGVWNPVVVAVRPDRSRCLYWPCSPVRDEAQTQELPVAEGGPDVASWYRRCIEEIISDGNISTRYHYGDVFLIPEMDVDENNEVVSRSDSADKTPKPRPRLEPVRRATFSNLSPRINADSHIFDLSQREAIAIAIIWLKYDRTKHGIVTPHYVLQARESTSEPDEDGRDLDSAGDENGLFDDSKRIDGTRMDGPVNRKLTLLNAHVTSSHLYECLIGERQEKSDDVDSDDIEVDQNGVKAKLAVDVAVQSHDLAKVFGDLSSGSIDTVIRESFIRAAEEELHLSYGIAKDDLKSKMRASLESEKRPFKLLTRSNGNRLLTCSISISLSLTEVETARARSAEKDGWKLVDISEEELMSGREKVNDYLKAYIASEGLSRKED